MNKGIDPHALVERLTKAGLTIDKCMIGHPVTKDDREFAKIIGATRPPKSIDVIYEAFNGFTLLWHGHVGSLALQGSVNILPFTQSVSRAALTESGAPLEDILWNQDSPAEVAEQLREMAIFEAVAGRSQFLTYRHGGDNANLFLVERDEIHPVVPDFNTSISLLFEFAGAEGLREHLVHDDWKERLEEDASLQRISAL